MRSCPWDSLSSKALEAVLFNLENLVDRAEQIDDHIIHTQFQVVEAPNKVDTYNIVNRLFICSSFFLKFFQSEIKSSIFAAQHLIKDLNLMISKPPVTKAPKTTPKKPVKPNCVRLFGMCLPRGTRF